MTFEELLAASANGLPLVIYNGIQGRITVIKDNGTYRGCAARFSNKDHDDWFHADADFDKIDKRSRYMFELKLVSKSTKQFPGTTKL